MFPLKCLWHQEIHSHRCIFPQLLPEDLARSTFRAFRPPSPWTPPPMGGTEFVCTMRKYAKRSFPYRSRRQIFRQPAILSDVPTLTLARMHPRTHARAHAHGDRSHVNRGRKWMMMGLSKAGILFFLRLFKLDYLRFKLWAQRLCFDEIGDPDRHFCASVRRLGPVHEEIYGEIWVKKFFNAARDGLFRTDRADDKFAAPRNRWIMQKCPGFVCFSSPE